MSVQRDAAVGLSCGLFQRGCTALYRKCVTVGNKNINSAYIRNGAVRVARKSVAVAAYNVKFFVGVFKGKVFYIACNIAQKDNSLCLLLVAYYLVDNTAFTV